MEKDQCERLMAEYTGLVCKCEALNSFLDRFPVPNAVFDQDLLEQQLVHMNEYKKILARRITNIMIRGTEELTVNGN